MDYAFPSDENAIQLLEKPEGNLMIGHRVKWDFPKESTRNESAQWAELVQNQRKMFALEDKIDRLTLICMGMWSLLKEKGGCTEQELADVVREIDLSDGRLDGKVKRRKLLECSRCKRVMAPRHIRCIYCGAERDDLVETEVFDRVL